MPHRSRTRALPRVLAAALLSTLVLPRPSPLAAAPRVALPSLPGDTTVVTPVEPAAPDSATVQPAVAKPAAAVEGLRVFLDCKAPCDFQYIIRATPFVTFVRDQEAAEVYVLVTQQFTGGGGRSVRLVYQGRERFDGQHQDLAYLSDQGETADERRRGFTRVLKLGLVPFAAQTRLAPQLDVAYAAEGARPAAPTAQDPWNNWVFRVGAGGSLNREASRGDTRFNGSFSADRVTDDWKLRSAVLVDLSQRDFKKQGQVITSNSHRISTDAAVVRSLSARWSFGLFSEVYSASFTNVDLGMRLTPGLEFNIFPWDISDRKEFTIAYTAGVRHFRYMEETIYGRVQETLTSESLRSSLRLTQPWGTLWANLEASHYLTELDKYRLVLGSNLSIRLTKGLSLEVGSRAESIHDQLYLPKGNATLEEILLQQRRQATTYDLSTNVGLRYTFGSVYNNVVNPRF